MDIRRNKTRQRDGCVWSDNPPYCPLPFCRVCAPMTSPDRFNDSACVSSLTIERRISPRVIVASWKMTEFSAVASSSRAPSKDLYAIAERRVDQLRVRVDVCVPVEGLVGGVEVGLWCPDFEQQYVRGRAGR